jgi:ComF family protein
LGERLGLLLGAVVGERLNGASALEPATIVPVPLHPIRYAERGYNQAEAVAVGVGRALGLPVSGNALIRRHLAASQVGRTREDRLEHVREAFAINPERRPGGAVILVDDVVTTGATMLAAVDALRRARLTCLHVAALAVVVPRT